VDLTGCQCDPDRQVLISTKSRCRSPGQRRHRLPMSLFSGQADINRSIYLAHSVENDAHQAEHHLAPAMCHFPLADRL
jgi:hypothetical protein